MNTTRKSFSELMSLRTFAERIEYLRLYGTVAYQTFGGSRWVNQDFYLSREWKLFRNDIIVRDNGCDLAIPGRKILGRIILHHINPIAKEDLILGTDCLLDPYNVICVSHLTHNAIHYGPEGSGIEEVVVRSPNDTCPWKGGRL